MLEDRFLADEEATIAAAQDLAPHLKRGQAVLLFGDLGAGKSTFARALVRALPLADGTVNPDEEVPSPTYTLMQSYDRALGPVAHFDLYRLGDPEEIWELGLEEAQAEGLTLIEWPQRLGPHVPTNRIELHLRAERGGRQLMVQDFSSPRT